MTKAKAAPPRGMLEMIVTEMATVSDTQADPHVKIEAKAAMERGLTALADHELYDIIQRIGNREPHCEVHPFVHTLCNLDAFYSRPAPPSPSDVEKK